MRTETRRARSWGGMILSLALIGTISSCAFVDESVSLNPTSSIPSSDSGHGQRVGLTILDERPSIIIGHRGPQRSAEIRAAQDVSNVVDQAVRQGLRNQGFEPVAFSRSEPVTLQVQVRDLSYDTSIGFWTGGIFCHASLKAVATNAGNSYEKLYRAEKEERVVVVPTAEADAASINEVLSQAIDQMMADQFLLDFLAHQAPSAGTPTLPAVTSAPPGS